MSKSKPIGRPRRQGQYWEGVGEKIEKTEEEQVKRGRKNMLECPSEQSFRKNGEWVHSVICDNMFMLLEPSCLKDTLLCDITLGQEMCEKRTARIDTALFDISPKALCTGITNILSQV